MARRTRKNIGIIGLGIIGSRVADNLRRKGLPVFVWNRTPRPVPNFVGSPTELAELCDIIQIFVSDDDALLEMVQRMKNVLNKQHIVISSSTVSPDTTRAAAEIVQKRGAQLVDAPFTGTREAAASGEMVYYVGGDAAALQEVRPVLEASSKEIIEIGGVGQASAIKIATNIVTAAEIQGASEALALAIDAGISPERFLTAMRSNGSHSRTLEMKLPKMISGNFETQFSVKHMLKDMAIASRTARALGLEFGIADVARHALQAQQRDGRGDLDYAALIRTFFPQDAPLRDMQSPPQPADAQQSLTGLEASLSTPPTEVASETASVSRELPPSEDTPTEKHVVEREPEIATAVASGNENGGEDAGGLFRRFVRRADY